MLCNSCSWHRVYISHEIYSQAFSFQLTRQQLTHIRLICTHHPSPSPPCMRCSYEPTLALARWEERHAWHDMIHTCSLRPCALVLCVGQGPLGADASGAQHDHIRCCKYARTPHRCSPCALVLRVGRGPVGANASGAHMTICTAARALTLPANVHADAPPPDARSFLARLCYASVTSAWLRVRVVRPAGRV